MRKRRLCWHYRFEISVRERAHVESAERGQEHFEPFRHLRIEHKTEPHRSVRAEGYAGLVPVEEVARYSEQHAEYVAAVGAAVGAALSAEGYAHEAGSVPVDGEAHVA